MNSISKSFKNNPIQPNNIVPIDFNNVVTLPDSHTWCSSSDDDDHQDELTSVHELHVPIVDLAHPNALQLIRKASEQWGMFQVLNHGISSHLLREIEQQTKKFFALPANRKLLAVRSEDGVLGYGVARISTFFSKQMWSEGFTIMGSPVQHASQIWPHDYTTFCKVMEEYQNEMKGVAEKIIELMLMSLGLTQDDVKWFRPKNGAQAVLQLNSYPVCPDPARAMGLAAHTDSSLLTLLHQTPSFPGLQLLTDATGWLPVQPFSGALVVNVGDLMHIVSNGRFKTTVHRAIVNNTHHRLSIAYFYGPSTDVKISPPVKLTDFDHPLLYRPVTWKEYLDAKAAHFDKAMDLIKI